MGNNRTSKSKVTHWTITINRLNFAQCISAFNPFAILCGTKDLSLFVFWFAFLIVQVFLSWFDRLFFWFFFGLSGFFFGLAFAF